MAPDHLIVARAEALFASDLSIHSQPTEATVTAAIRRAVRVHGGIRGCVGEVGAAYGDYPETAAERMRWARQVIEEIFSSGTTLPGGNAAPVMTSVRNDGRASSPYYAE